MIKFIYFLENFRVDDNVIVSRICGCMVYLFGVLRRCLGYCPVASPRQRATISVNGREFLDQHAEKRLWKGNVHSVVIIN